MTPNKTRYQDLCQSLEDARKRSRDYRSDCVFFAATFVRNLTEYLGARPDAVTYHAVAGMRIGEGPVRPEEALHLDEDTYWHLGLAVRIGGEEASDEIPLHVRFKRIERRYVINLFGHEDFEVAEPTPSALEPVFEEFYESMKRHYEDGLRLFLDKRGQNLHLPFTAARHGDIAGGS